LDGDRVSDSCTWAWVGQAVGVAAPLGLSPFLVYWGTAWGFWVWAIGIWMGGLRWP
jgi:hypothetical protein